jgi:sodium/bile acid cotransporter 7
MSIRATLSRLGIDPYLFFLLGTVALAALLPARGLAAVVVGHAVHWVVALLFFVYGAKLSTSEVLRGLLHWRLQGAVFACTFILFPALGLIAVTLLGSALPPPLATGILFVAVLPSTVQSSIAFTSIARGNVPAALCSASVSNLAGMIITPLLVMLLLHAKGGFSAGALEDIALQLLAPFAAGQLLRPILGPVLKRHRLITTIVDRGSILVVVYAAFSAGMVGGIWSRVSPESLALVMLVDAALLALVLTVTSLAGALGFSREDRITLIFCGSKKSLASGIPMANILFPAQTVGLIVLPLMLFHQFQLFVCTLIAQRFARAPEAAPAPAIAAPESRLAA